MEARFGSNALTEPPDAREPADRLLRDLRSGRGGLTERDARRRLVVAGPNELRRARGRSWPRELARQLVHPLALLLWAASALALATHAPVIAVAILAVLVVNALFAFVQEQQAERAVEALERYLPREATVIRDGHRRVVDAQALVPGDILVVSEGERVCADARLLEGSVEIDLSALTGESLPVFRAADLGGTDVPFLDARDLLFSGSVCTGGEAVGLVFATGMSTELGRIAALSQRVVVEESPLEHEVRRVAWVIALVAVLVGFAFLPLGRFGAGLPLGDAIVFAVGLLVANVPEGLLPTITLALAIGVRSLARRGALVKRLSAVETLGSTTVICTDKTGTLTENRMRAVAIWTHDVVLDLEHDDVDEPRDDPLLDALAEALAACSNAELNPERPDEATGDATEVALLLVADRLGADVRSTTRERRRIQVFHFDPALKLMSTVDEADGGVILHAKGAPEAILARSAAVLTSRGERVLDLGRRRELERTADEYAARGLRVLAVARKTLVGGRIPGEREEAEAGLCLLGFVALFDPPRAGVADAVARCHDAGMRVIVVTGDHGLTAAEIAQRVGIGGARPVVVSGAELDAMNDAQLDRLLRRERELVFARASPEAKLRIADSLKAQGEVVAMTGDGVNDAPALHRADIGVAMGRSGTDVAREAATMILTDDNFATIVAAVAEGRRVFANVRKFVFYIFVHATPEVVPFLLFALSGGLIPLPLTVLQILAIDLGTETLPALALAREPAEPGEMSRPPRRRSEGVIGRRMLVRAWLFLGLISAGLVVAGFFYVLLGAGWSPGDDVSAGSPLHDAYLEATTMTFLGIVVCQVGTAMAARTDRASLRSVGVWSNPLLLWGIAFELAFAAALIYLPPLQALFRTRPLGLEELLFVLPFPFVVWGADELRRYLLRSVAA